MNFKTPEANNFYRIGYKDALTKVFLAIRSRGLKPGMKHLAEELLKNDPKNNHAEWFLETFNGK